MKDLVCIAAFEHWIVFGKSDSGFDFSPEALRWLGENQIDAEIDLIEHKQMGDPPKSRRLAVGIRFKKEEDLMLYKLSFDVKGFYE